MASTTYYTLMIVLSVLSLLVAAATLQKKQKQKQKQNHRSEHYGGFPGNPHGGLVSHLEGTIPLPILYHIAGTFQAVILKKGAPRRMLTNFLTGLGLFLLYYVLAASLLLFAHRLLSTPRELFRKLLHIACVLSILVPTLLVPDWRAAALIPLAFAALIYPAIRFLERYPAFMSMLVQRRRGEIASSLVLVFVMMASLIAVFWGLLGQRHIVVVAIMAWGFGDAAAAVVGTAFGRWHLQSPLIEGTKSVEGTLAMYLTSAVAILVTLLLATDYPAWVALLCAAVVAAPCAVVELFSRHGMDTITVPYAAAVSLWALEAILRALGGIA